MELFLFTNFFPFKKAEPFLVNEFEFTKRYAKSITVLTLYGAKEEHTILEDSTTTFLQPLLRSPANKRAIFFKGIFNFSGFSEHLKEFFQKKIFLSPKKLRWFITSLLICRIARSSAAYKELEKKIEQAQKPVLYFYWGDNLCWLIPYLKKKFQHKQLLILLRVHGSDLYEHLKDDYAPLRKSIFKAADHLLPVSGFGQNYLAEKYPQFKHKIVLSRLGVFDHGINPYQPGAEKVIVSVSNLVTLKRIDLIFETLQKAVSRITWHHFGDGPLAPELKALIKQAREGLQIIFHGYVNNQELMEFYKTHPVDLFFNLSSTEGLPVSIMEALSFGIPVIATNVGGTSDLVSAKVGALISADFNTGELAQTTDAFLSQNTDRVEELRHNARQIFREKVWADKNYTELYQFIEAQLY